jgi:hypothetical protein
MTAPDERTRVIRQTREFLEELCARTPTLPVDTKREARRLLRHYPSNGTVDTLVMLASVQDSSPLAGHATAICRSRTHHDSQPRVDRAFARRSALFGSGALAPYIGRSYGGPNCQSALWRDQGARALSRASGTCKRKRPNEVRLAARTGKNVNEVNGAWSRLSRYVCDRQKSLCNQWPLVMPLVRFCMVAGTGFEPMTSR